MSSISLNADNVRALMPRMPEGKPIVLINQLRFLDVAAYPEGSPFNPSTGRDAYLRYADLASPLVYANGGILLWRGEGLGTMVGPTSEEWHTIFMIRYPSLNAFLRMLVMADYQKVSFHRLAALADSRLLISSESDNRL